MASYSGSSGNDLAVGLADILQRMLKDAARLHVQEALRLQAQEAERRAQDAVLLQEQRSASASRHLEQQLQERDGAIGSLRHSLDERMQRMEQRVAALEERERVRSCSQRTESEAAEELGSVGQLESRMGKLEGAVQRALTTVFPRVETLVAMLEKTSPPGAPCARPATSTSISNSTSPSTSGSTSISSCLGSVSASIPTSASNYTFPSYSTFPTASTSSTASASTTISTSTCSPTSDSSISSGLLSGSPVSPFLISEATSSRAPASQFTYVSFLNCPTITKSPYCSARSSTSVSTSASTSKSTSPASTCNSASSSIATSTASASAVGATASQEARKKLDELCQRELVERRLDEVIARRFRAKMTPSPLGEDLCRAAVEGKLWAVQSLLNLGADVNYVGPHGGCPLTCMFLLEDQVGTCDVAVLSALLKAGANVDAINLYGYSALHFAACVDTSGRCVRQLIDAGAPVDARDVEGATPLHCAAEEKNVEAVRALLAAGADKHLRGWGGRFKNQTPFQLAGSDAVRNVLR